MTSPKTSPRSRTSRRALSTFAALALGVLSACAPTASDTVYVFGASSTRVINEQLQQQADELKVVFNNNGSSTLVTQLHEGAPADILITADEASMDQALADGSVLQPRPLARNTMVMVVPKDNPAEISGIQDLNDSVNLVLCDPQVPCGKVSAQIMEHNDAKLHPASLEGAVGDVLGKVVNGEADAGWVYATDARAAAEDVEVIELPGAQQFPTTLYAAMTTNSQDPELGQKIFQLIFSEEISQALSDAGFQPL